ncbi:bifunctional UDP-N-acetylmuramoyl-tripeptide:D-alanyl-D-alanine ligase/alanine racemase [Echinicola marina]|uniref:bifunctional UDP-N-acetylmuramoyl-tripeptide:D-alanyl-D-alanine ligase/alanine racemase n=1 Tax=Echinicola marina TaxID=2859768 RepID=UPI001CF6C0F5|nr:bifunctional UDP-N-acetylmuramoyl-tripeptide:D-alanyl-D-alanine ligase/alanine racemase [Echinicola marina]UCS94400.1 bifunctional UDP-N-acetylmuramoyl-tripeptide:D-alanyl-D-alanine ligase/alanine racemase [Echinicola marina]
MIKAITAQTLPSIINGQFIQEKNDLTIKEVLTDSRKIISGKETVFVALKGFKVNGQDYLEDAYRLGVRNFVVQEKTSFSKLEHANILLVPNTAEALQALAQYNRVQFSRPVIGITGSNGKTIVKEWLGQLLSQKFHVAKSPKSYNSQIGVPLSIFMIEQQHQAAILEAGISRPGEMSKLEKMIKPSMGIFTNIGTAHAEGFQNQREKLKEKLLLFKDAQYIIYRKDQKTVHNAMLEHFDMDRLISWSEIPGADYTLSTKRNHSTSKITLIKPDMGLYTFETSFTDEASLENLRHAIVAGLVLGMTEKDIQACLPQLNTVEMRLTLKSGLHQCLLIDDTYNNDLAGLDIALEFLQNQRPKKRKILILSDLLQAGKSASVYKKVRELIQHNKLDLLIAVGKEIKELEHNPPCESLFFGNTAELLSALPSIAFNNDLILIKGARAFAFEQVVNALQAKLHGTVLEINLNALRRNFTFYKEQIKPATKIMVMVKAFAYGGGATEIAHHLEQLKADYLAVAYTDEGVSLKEDKIKLPIMVLNPAPESFGNLIKYNLEPVVYSLSFFEQLGRFCQNQSAVLNIHLDLDTGMHRLGFDQEDLETLKDLISAYPELRIASLYTHLVGADESIHEDFSLEQIHRFKLMGEALKEDLGYKPMMHALNSAGILRYPTHQFDMVRLGIGLYGVEVNGLHETALQPVSILKTTISQIKHLKKGQTVGYSRKGLMQRDGKIATIAIGYADGYDRRFSNGVGKVMINGQMAPIIGNICMDMSMVDITDIDAAEGDEVIIYGNGLSLKEQANAIGTIPYELLTNISDRVKRTYFLD